MDERLLDEQGSILRREQRSVLLERTAQRLLEAWVQLDLHKYGDLYANPIQDPNNPHGWSKGDFMVFRHMSWMLQEMSTFSDDAHGTIKFHRWQAFIQGVLWHRRVLHIDDLREDSRGTF